jgi:hypothetical protein
LHTTASLAMHKEVEVKATAVGISADFAGPEKYFGGVLKWNQWEEIVEVFPRLGLGEGVKEIFL